MSFGKLYEKMSGLLMIILGSAALYVDYFILKIIFESSKWLAGFLNAPEAVSFLIGIVISVILFSIILSIFIVGFCVILYGVTILLYG